MASGGHLVLGKLWVCYRAWARISAQLARDNLAYCFTVLAGPLSILLAWVIEPWSIVYFFPCVVPASTHFCEIRASPYRIAGPSLLGCCFLFNMYTPPFRLWNDGGGERLRCRRIWLHKPKPETLYRMVRIVEIGMKPGTTTVLPCTFEGLNTRQVRPER
ncbi:hypothetical protein EDD16DRAFT_1596531 [Pisolithus croceorrhizus]|nr:hypothetical protein EDD16DRAFT_1596531 [Pisolithus croceorrhizus]